MEVKLNISKNASIVMTLKKMQVKFNISKNASIVISLKKCNYSYYSQKL